MAKLDLGRVVNYAVAPATTVTKSVVNAVKNSSKSKNSTANNSIGKINSSNIYAKVGQKKKDVSTTSYERNQRAKTTSPSTQKKEQTSAKKTTSKSSCSGSGTRCK